MRERIDAILETIRPAVLAHGGEIAVGEIDEVKGRVGIRFRGACGHCALTPVTLKLGVEPLLKKAFSWITEVVAE
jgi:Fe-S cluster biogenesis protein NfuA